MTAALPAFGPIGREVYERTYQRPEDADWYATVRRVVNGNTDLVPASHLEATEITELTALLSDFRAVPAGRHLFSSGSASKLALFNCHRSFWTDRLADFFGFNFDQLLLGGGVGANFSSEYLELSGPLSGPVDLELLLDPSHPDADECAAMVTGSARSSHTVIVGDSRECWVDALTALIDAHSYGVADVSLDLSAVRARGCAIAGFGGTASGPGPLAELLIGANEILNRAALRVLTPLEAMDLAHSTAACVVAGNVRRSARMSILHWADPYIFDFIACKADPSKHWSTNISVEVDDAFFAALDLFDTHACDVLEAVCEGIYANGEPGFYNSSLASVGERRDVRATNPCGEIGLEDAEPCVLGHVDLSRFVDDHDGAREAFRLMTRYLMRATFGSTPSAEQREVLDRNRRIGVGFFGFADWASMLGVRYDEIGASAVIEARLADYAAVVDLEADVYAAELMIARPIKTRTVAPTGSIAKLSGSSEGVQPPFARFFVRRVRYASADPKLLELAHLPQEPCLYSPNTTVVSFTVQDPITLRVDTSLVMQSDEIGLRGYLETQAMVQRVWADNAVSVTANFNRDATSPLELAHLMQEFLPALKGWTGMPEDGRPQSPYERLTSEQFNAAELTGISQAMDDCATGACPVR